MAPADLVRTAARVVVDVGHSRLKWAVLDCIPLPSPQHPPPLQPRLPVPVQGHTLANWSARLLDELAAPPDQVRVAVSGSNRSAQAQLLTQLQAAGIRTQHIHTHTAIPLPVAVDVPERVGLDRLLNALAARARVAAGTAAIIVDAGTAVTVDLLDASGAFAGGTIAPGLMLLPRALHDHTTTLPLLSELPLAPSVPGRNTVSAMQAGVVWMFVGGVRELVERLAGVCAHVSTILVTGGDGPRLGGWPLPTVACPTLTLEGIALAAAEFLA